MIWLAASRALSFLLSLCPVHPTHTASQAIFPFAPPKSRARRATASGSVFAFRLPFFGLAPHHLRNGKRHDQYPQNQGNPVQPEKPIEKNYNSACQAEPLHRWTHDFTSRVSIRKISGRAPGPCPTFPASGGKHRTKCRMRLPKLR